MTLAVRHLSSELFRVVCLDLHVAFARHEEMKMRSHSINRRPVRALGKREDRTEEREIAAICTLLDVEDWASGDGHCRCSQQQSRTETGTASSSRHSTGTGGRHADASLRVVACFMQACTSGGWSSANRAIPLPVTPWRKM